MIGNEAQDSFINRSKWAVATTVRANGTPTASVVHFARDGDDLVFSTLENRVKTKTLQRDGRMALCILDAGAPYGYVTVEGSATIEKADILTGHVLLGRWMQGPDFAAPPGFEEGLRKDGRVIIRLRPDRVSGFREMGMQPR